MALSSSIPACWVEIMFRESSFISSCSAFPSAARAIAIAPWWWGTIASIKRLSEYLPFCMTICLAMSLDPMPIEPWPIWPRSILP